MGELSGVAPGAGLTVYVGVGPRGGGIHRLVLDRATGRLILRDVAEEQSPGWLALDSRQGALYAGLGGNRLGGWRIDRETGKLHKRNARPTGTGGFAHISIDPNDSMVMGASYGGGTVGVHPILAPGEVGESSCIVQHEGDPGPAQPDQSQARPHQVPLDPAGRWAVVNDLGLDRVYVYRADAQGKRLVPNDPPYVQGAPGRGPRHGAFHPSGRWYYVINELDSTMTAFAWDGEKGTLRELQNVTTLPEGWQGSRWSAQVVVHPDGRWLYGSNRDANGDKRRRGIGTAFIAEDDIVVYEIDQRSGQLITVGHHEAGGKNPRNFNVEPSGQFLLCAHQDSDTIVVFRIDQDTGKLVPTGHDPLEIGTPVCVRFALDVGVS
ncbi:MAG TPA: lactonase family protein [Chloroflexota bacterium]|nr:lactonase family protein [Chloroflexota bacterium]